MGGAAVSDGAAFSVRLSWPVVPKIGLALVLATGLIVDDAIVVLENAQRLQGKGLGRKAAAVIGTRQVFFAVVATTAVLVSVFVPISFLPSETGRLFREFGFVLSVAVLISSFIALSLVPALAARIDLTNGAAENDRLTRWGGHARDRYMKMLTWCLDRGKLVVIAAVLVAGLTGLLYTQIDNELVPDEDRGVIEVDATGPDGVGLAFMDRELDEIERILQPYLDSGEIESTFSVVGQWDTQCTDCATCASGAYRDGYGGASEGTCETCAVGTFKSTLGTWDTQCAACSGCGC